MDSSIFVIILFCVFIVIFVATAAISLLGLIKKVNIDDKYLSKLFVLLILEVVGAVIALFGSADFFGTSAPDFIAELPPAVRADSVEVARQEIIRVVAEREQYRVERDELQEQVNEISAELDRYAELENNAFLLFARLSSDINRNGGFFINLTYRSQEKQEEAARICDVLKVLYGATGCSDPDPFSVSQYLSMYQQAWQFQATDGHFGQQTLVAIINEYLLLVRGGTRSTADSDRS